MSTTNLEKIMLVIKILTTVFEDKSEAYELAFHDTDRDEVIQFDIGSIDGAEEIVAVINNHACDTIKVISDKRVY